MSSSSGDHGGILLFELGQDPTLRVSAFVVDARGVMLEDMTIGPSGLDVT